MAAVEEVEALEVVLQVAEAVVGEVAEVAPSVSLDHLRLILKVDGFQAVVLAFIIL